MFLSEGTRLREGVTRHAAALACVLAAAVAFGGNASAELYRVQVKRVASNVYKDTISGVYIETRLCSEFARNEEAVLIYDDPAHGSRLIFPGGKTCEVTGLFE